MLKSSKKRIISIYEWVNDVKIYDYDGRKNISGERIRQLRCKRHWSQDVLAKHLQLAGVVIGRDSVNRIEKGTRFVADYEIRAFYNGPPV